MGPPTPILRSFDERRTKGFYVDFLGFEIEFEHRFEPGTPLYLGLRKDGCRLHLSEHYGDGSPGAHVRVPQGHCGRRASRMRGRASLNGWIGGRGRSPCTTRRAIA